MEYRKSETDPPTKVSFPVPPGEYTTMELLDELEEVMAGGNGDGTKFVMKYTEGGFVNVSLENGEKVDGITGGLSYLMYDTYKGGSTGMLIGTTIFPSENTRLTINAGVNDEMTFVIEDFKGGSRTKKIKIPAGDFTRSELIDKINAQLTDTTVKASAHGTGIRLGSKEAIVTGFKGNMFKIDGRENTSVFYDNVKYGSVTQTKAEFRGGCVLTTDARDPEHTKFVIDSTNNVLTLQPNGMENSVDLVIPEDEYTADTMCDKLNELFRSQGLDLNASAISENKVLDTSVVFKGIKIVSGIYGPDSKVNLDKTSSAYDTLFTAREYNRYGQKASLINENKQDKDAWFWGGKNLSGLSSAAPLELTSSNNKFEITIKDANAGEVTRTITLPPTKYYGPGDVVAKITSELEAYIDTKDKVKVTLDNGRIKFEGKDGKSVDSISVNPNSSSYDALFKGTTISYLPTTNSGTGSITLDTPGGVSSGSMVIMIDNVPHTVTFPPNASKDEIEKAIDSQIKADKNVYLNRFDHASGTGSNSDRNFSGVGKGSESVKEWSGSAQGTSTGVEGVAGFTSSTPAILEVGARLKDSMTLDSGNNGLRLTLNGQTQLLTLAEGTYSPAQLKDEIQLRLDETFGNDWGGATVDVVGNQLVLTSRLPDGYDGKKSSISCGTDSSLLKYLNTVENPAVWRSNLALDSSVKINANNNQFRFVYEENGNSRDITLTLADGDYAPDKLVDQLNIQLGGTGTGIKASLFGERLQLTSASGGSDVAIRYNTMTGGSSANTLFGDLTGAAPARAVIDMSLQHSIKIEPDKLKFRISVNGQPHELKLKAGTYDRDSFRNMVNDCLKAQGVAAEAYLSGSKIGFRTTAKGAQASVEVSYDDSADSAMSAVYGSTTNIIPGVDASWNGDKLTLRAVDTEGNTLPNKVTVASGSSGGLQQSKVVTSYNYPTGETGYHSTLHSNVDGVNLTGDVEIDKWNKELELTFSDNGKSTPVKITLNEGSYTYDNLKTALQNELDRQTGAGRVKVTVDAHGVKIEAADPGSRYGFSGLAGGFYWKVLCACSEKNDKQSESDRNGTQSVNQAYTVGRRDIKNQTVEINKGISDELSIDMTYENKVHTVKVTLDPGRYRGETLRQHVQDKLDEELVRMGLKKGLIEVGVGDVNTGVQGGCDNEALNFRLSKDVSSPARGDVIIDGVRGNAAFEIFYQTDGRMIPAYIMGTKDITSGTTINKGETELAFDVDGTVYSVDLDEGDYSATELIDMINQKFAAGGVPLIAILDPDSGKMKISHRQIDQHEIREVSGGAKNNVFFAEHGERDHTVRYVQMSEAWGDRIDLPRSEFGTAMMGIHSICITKPKYAEKALERMSAALGKISALRDAFGSTQNRLEHAIRNNENSEENMQAAESIIRDTDMAGELVRHANQNILLQAGQSMLAQANKNRDFILGLLS